MTLSDAAAARLRALYEHGDGRLLRISVNTKGCSGLAYDMTWVAEPGPGDEQVRDHELTVLVDRKASLFLIGTVMGLRTEGSQRRVHIYKSQRERAVRLRGEFSRVTPL